MLDPHAIVRRFSAAGLLRVSAIPRVLRLRTVTERVLAFAVRLEPDSLDTSYAHARSLMHLERFEESLGIFEKLVHTAPHVGGWHYERGWLLQKLDRHEEAVAAFDLALSAEWPDSRGHLDRGLSLENLDRPREAYQAYERALRHDPSDSFANKYAARSAADRGDWALTAQRCQLAYDAMPDTENAVALAEVRGALREWHEAERILRLAHKRDAASADLRISLCRVLIETDRLDEALDLARAVVEDYPENESARVMLCAALSNRGLHDEAEVIAEGIVERQPDLSWAHGNRGWVALKSDKPQKALESFDRAIELDPDDLMASVYRAAALTALDRNAEAVAAFETIVATNPTIIDEDPQLRACYEAARKNISV